MVVVVVSGPVSLVQAASSTTAPASRASFMNEQDTRTSELQHPARRAGRWREDL
jgi:hypothetical protein